MKYFLILILTIITLHGYTQTNDVVSDWIFHPHYTLPGNASAYPGPFIPNPSVAKPIIEIPGDPVLFHNQFPTDRLTNLLEKQQIPTREFSAELWLCNHVNQPIGITIGLKEKNNTALPYWVLGYYDDTTRFFIGNGQQYTTVTVSNKNPFKKYWHHIVAVVDNQAVKIFLNGREIKKAVTGEFNADNRDQPEIEIAAYTKNEPYMTIPDLLKASRIHKSALSASDIKARYDSLCDRVEQGIVFPELFHFNAGPYLQLARENDIRINWETSETTSAVIRYGEQLPLNQSITIEHKSRIHEATLTELKPATSYFYEIIARNKSGKEISTGVYTFKTATPDSAFTFAVIGDTEARPWINHALGLKIWNERPEFVVNLGDLTDGGKEPHKFEWNYEYFTGITPLASRIPVVPVPGNGEGDLYWYKKYHNLPGNEAYYSYQFGNAEFFLLNSNEREQFKPGGEQYQWLENKLQQSTAQWKFVAHHHAPYSSDENDYGNSWEGKSNLGDLDVREIVPLYEKYGVDIVMFGHLHTYQRTFPIKDNRNADEGVVYIQAGGAGGNLEDFTPNRSWFSSATHRGHHYLIFTIHYNQLIMKMHGIDGQLLDFLEINK
ncbi:MAG: hypothetical protein GVY19_05630 [Bacteroidetes bacterium]|jgi:hypothetical protein|nr:hypothetical protein [Bacteroidota bacterium]